MTDLNADLITHTTLRAIDDAIRQAAEAAVPRGHLGMSTIGHEDSRLLWLRFRWCLPEITEPRTLRIFRLGDLLELEVLRLLRNAGFKVLDADEDGEQFRFAYLGGHFGGSMDGAIRGIPEAPKTWHVLEIKSVNGTRFKDLVKKGVKDWSPAYYGQMQCYMGASGMTRALFVAYNKDTSELYHERVYPEKMYWESAQVKAQRIIDAAEPPESAYAKREDYRLRMMSDKDQAIYWCERLPDRPNCRNCRHGQPVMAGGAQWHCVLRGLDCGLTEHQWQGCDRHNWIPALVPAETLAVHEDCVQYRSRDGIEFWNTCFLDGVDHPNTYASQELSWMSRIGLNVDTLDDEFINQCRAEFGGGTQVQWLDKEAS